MTDSNDEVFRGGAVDGIGRNAAERSLAALVAKVHGIRPLPESVQRLIAMTQDEAFDVDELARLVEADASLAARVLRLVNSAGFGLRTACKSITHAIVLLGPRKLRELATTAAVLDLVEDGGVWSQRIGEHAMYVAAICRKLAPMADLPWDDAFTCGLLHDVGKLMLLQAGGVEYPAMLAAADGKPDTLHRLERARYGFDHAVLGSHVLASWKLPDPVPSIVGWHHDPALAYEAPPRVVGLVQLVRLADKLAYSIGDTPPPADYFDVLGQETPARYLMLTSEDLSTVWPQLRALCEATRDALVGVSDTAAVETTPPSDAHVDRRASGVVPTRRPASRAAVETVRIPARVPAESLPVSAIAFAMLALAIGGAAAFSGGPLRPTLAFAAVLCVLVTAIAEVTRRRKLSAQRQAAPPAVAAVSPPSPARSAPPSHSSREGSPPAKAASGSRALRR
jgi:HD-like signal output (HDOD) protein